MSFKDVRDLGEQLKLLGFPRVFPLQSLGNQHGSLASFHIVAELLQWLAELLEPGAVLAGGVSTEEQRVLLIRAATEFFVTKSGIRLNPRKLYAAAAVSAMELQKITRLLIAPQQSQSELHDEEREQYRSLNQVDIGDKLEQLRRARELSSELTQRGAALHDLLSQELLHKEARLAQAQRPMELLSVERSMKQAIQSNQLKLQSSRAQLENSRVELNALNSKLQRKRAELERTKQRLEALQKIRPAHMAEFEEYEQQLQQLFQRYFLRLHVRDALRTQLEARSKRRATPTASPLLQKPAENSIPFIPEGLIEDDDDDDEDDDDDDVDVAQSQAPGSSNVFALDAEIPDIRDEDLLLQRSQTSKRPGTATSRIRPTTGRSRRATATATAGAAAAAAPPTRNGREGPGSSMLRRRDANADDSSFGSSDSELDVGDIMTMAPGDDDFDLNSIDDISISKLTGELPLRPKTASKPEHHSDEDF
ncbi:CG17599 [Drosophila busckii]|uniref:CG17599 n=1 Tax=Drosophila busckii TaxID=30019 RepID=A0A0M4EVV5_DROBS|nr:clusterin-associated protein 1 [Drosophila busckii]XP_017851902.1 clusterin-associated protein 1 [Drosophila busckii]ALC49460.1 CG17599 [Drosophila busckii]